jgi:cytochrome c oxidase subunit 2
LLQLAPTVLAFFSPKPGASPNANEINDLYKIVLYAGLVVFFGVEGTLAYVLFRFRARRGAVAKQLHGNTRLEIGWTLGAVGIVLVLAVLTLVTLSSVLSPPNSSAGGVTASAVGEGGELYASAERNLPPNKKSLNITVIGRQFIWQYIYPGANNKDGLGAPYSYEEMVVPTETTVTLNVVSEDVVHSWWIPELGGKLQAVPGYHNYGWFKISKPGYYRGQCANICGRGHARMIATVHAVPPAQFEAWLNEQKRLIAQANAEAAKERATLAAQNGPGQVGNP